MLLGLVATTCSSYAQTGVVDTANDFVMDAYVDQHISCRFNNDGYIQVNNNPTSIYDYYLKRGKDTIHNQHGTFKGLKPGVYKVWSTNFMGVTKKTKLRVESPKSLKVRFDIEKYPTVADNTGDVYLYITGGSPNLQPYLVSWFRINKDNTLTRLNPDPDDNFKDYMLGLPAGNYKVIIEDDNGCFLEKALRLKKKP